MSLHSYDPECNCDPCFTVWRAEAAAERALAAIRGERRRAERTALWREMLRHFTRPIGEGQE